MTSFGSTLRRLRHDRKLSQVQLAFQAGLTPTTVTKLELGQTLDPSWETVQALARALDVEVGVFASNGKEKIDGD